MESVTDGPNSATYSYLENTRLVEQIVFKHDGNTRMITTKTYAKLNRLTVIDSVTNGTSLAKFSYAYNAANQR